MAGVLDMMDFSNSLKRYMQRRSYKRLDKNNRGGRRLRIVRLGGHNVWRLKSVAKLRLSVKSAVKISAKSWLARIRNTYVNMMLSLAPSRLKEPCAKKGVEIFNDKVIVEIYKSLGVQIQVLPDEAKTSGDNLIRLRSIRV